MLSDKMSMLLHSSAGMPWYLQYCNMLWTAVPYCPFPAPVETHLTLPGDPAVEKRLCPVQIERRRLHLFRSKWIHNTYGRCRNHHFDRPLVHHLEPLEL